MFYKPLFACAASSKEVTIGNHLSILFAVSRFLPDFWTRDAEMMSVALMSDPASGKKTQSVEDESVPWGNARLGQSVLLLELIARIQGARLNREGLAAVCRHPLLRDPILISASTGRRPVASCHH